MYDCIMNAKTFPPDSTQTIPEIDEDLFMKTRSQLVEEKKIINEERSDNLALREYNSDNETNAEAEKEQLWIE